MLDELKACKIGIYSVPSIYIILPTRVFIAGGYLCNVQISA